MKKMTMASLLIISFCFISQNGFASAVIGTGGKTGVYYSVGKVICKIVNKKASKYNYRYQAEKSFGSVSNINYVLKGSFDIGFAQSDRQYEAYNGSGQWQSAGPQKELRSIMSLHPEVITLIASQKSHVSSLEGLKGKRVDIGPSGSGQNRNARDILAAAHISLNDVRAQKSSTARIEKLILDDKIDAFFYTVGHPNEMIRKLSEHCPISIVPITGPGIDALVGKYPYYTKSDIPGGIYPAAAASGNIDSIGVTATLITTRKINDHVIYYLVKGIFENLNELKKSHPALRQLTKQNMLKGLTAPIHSGAMAYYREAGLK